MSNDGEMAKGFTCECGRYEAWGVYAAAHWYEMLKFTCPDCGARYEVLEGKAVPKPKQVKRVTARAKR